MATIQVADKPTVDEILALLKNAEVGLAALKLLLGSNADAETMNVIKSLLQNNTYGLAALKNAITGRANETTVVAVKALLENGTYGLNALKTAISNANKFSNATAGVLQINTKLVHNGYTSSNAKIYTAYSPEINISGNGQIIFYEAQTGSYGGGNTPIMKLVDLVVDGSNIPTEIADKWERNGFTIALGTVQETGLKRKVEFGKSLKCKLGFYCQAGTSQTIDAVCTASAHYFVQLR